MKRFLKRYWVYVAVILATFCLLGYRDFTPDNELRYVSIAAEALRDGHIFAFFNHGLPYADKPPLYMWICVLGYWLFDTGCQWFIVTFFSLLPGIVATEVVARMCEPLLGRRWADCGRLMLCTSALFLGMMLTMRMDMLMCMFIVLAINSFFRQYRAFPKGEVSRKEQWLFGLWLFLALFTKGPYGLLIPLVSTLLFLLVRRAAKRFFHFWGWRTWIVLLAGCVVWFSGVYLDGGTSYLDNLLFHQTVGRAVNSFHHKEPFWYYGITVWYSIAPWCLAIIGGVTAALCKRPAEPRSDEEVLLLSTVGATFLLLSCVSSKLAIYLLPAFPYLIFAGTFAMKRFDRSRWMAAGLGVPAAIFCLAIFSVPILTKRVDMLQDIRFFLYLAGAILLIGGLLCLLVLIKRKRHMLSDAVQIIAVTMFVVIFECSNVFDELNPYIGYEQLAAKSVELAEAQEPKAHIYYYRVRRVENIDVFMPDNDYTIIEDPEKLGITVGDVNKRGILVVKNTYLTKAAEAIEGRKPAAQVGDYLLFDLNTPAPTHPLPHSSTVPLTNSSTQE